MNPFQLVYESLLKKHIDIKQHVKLSNYTTLHIGGSATLFVDVRSVEDIKTVITQCQKHKIPFYVIGRGSNILASDDGYDGLLLYMGDHFNAIQRIGKNCVKVQSGATLKHISDFCIQHRLGGFEFACGIPGSAGGGVRMNAGAYDGEMKDIVKEVTYLDEHLQCITRSNHELDFSYRNSYFQHHFGVILEVIYELYPKEQHAIQERVDALMKRRYEKQPMSQYSAGSTFKRPVGNYASALIRQAGLQGLQVGNAQVSTKHAGFLINLEHASSKDFQQLIQIVQQSVKEHSGYDLECEIKFLP